MKTRREWLPVVAVAAVASLAPSVGWAQLQTAPVTPVTARTMALGGGTYGVAMSTSSIYSNPAAMSLGRVYHVDSSVGFDPSVNRWAFGGAVVDSTRMVGAGLAYTFGTNPTSGHSSHDLRLALGVLLAEGVTLGVTGRYMDYEGDAVNANGGLGPGYSGFTVDVGVAVRPWRWLSLGVVGFSLTNPDAAISPLAVGGGFGVFPIERLGIIGDVYWDFRTHDTPRARWSGGVEFMANQFPLRIGYAYDDTRADQSVHLVTAGVGYLSQSFGAEFAMRQEVSGGDQTTLLLNLRYFHRLM